MDFLPIFLKIERRTCLLVGGGQVAFRKAKMLLRAGARIRLVAPAICDELKELLQEEEHETIQRPYEDADMEGVSLVIAASNDETLNRQIYQQGRGKSLPVNVVDNPALCDFIFPSIVDRNPVIVAVSSGGSSPVLARLLRARLETFIPSAYGRLASLLAGFRNQAKEKIPPGPNRMRFWEGILSSPVAELALAGKNEEAKALLESSLSSYDGSTLPAGEVYLVGAGPGDPDLLTFRALRLMQQADVVLYDRLVSDEIINMTRQDAEKIHVGKQRARHTVPQAQISQMLVDYAKAGKRVLRLKGGDPFIFGRGGEEIQQLASQGIPFQVVPGITAASGCACYAGIPLTHRDYAQSVRFVTGHLKDDSCDLDWMSLQKEDETLVFYMGLVGLEVICRELIRHGREESTPIALIQQGTTANQQVLTGTLKTMPGIVAATAVKAPTLIIVGKVVDLHDKLSWRH